MISRMSYRVCDALIVISPVLSGKAVTLSQNHFIHIRTLFFFLFVTKCKDTCSLNCYLKFSCTTDSKEQINKSNKVADRVSAIKGTAIKHFFYEILLRVIDFFSAFLPL